MRRGFAAFWALCLLGLGVWVILDEAGIMEVPAHASACPAADDFYRGLSRNVRYTIVASWDVGGGRVESIVARGEETRCVSFPRRAASASAEAVTLRDEPAYLFQRAEDIR